MVPIWASRERPDILNSSAPILFFRRKANAFHKTAVYRQMFEQVEAATLGTAADDVVISGTSAAAEIVPDRFKNSAKWWHEILGDNWAVDDDGVSEGSSDLSSLAEEGEEGEEDPLLRRRVRVDYGEHKDEGNVLSFFSFSAQRLLFSRCRSELCRAWHCVPRARKPRYPRRNELVRRSLAREIAIEWLRKWLRKFDRFRYPNILN